MTGSRLLVMACSARKRAQAVCAVDLYDGSSYQVLKKRNVGFFKIPVLILSAKYGLIPATKQIVTYDLKMTPLRAAELSSVKRVTAAAALVRSTPGWPFAEIFCHGGVLYRSVLKSYVTAGVFGRARVHYSGGRIGEQLSQLVAFLESR